jgi:MFS family permease
MRRLRASVAPSPMPGASAPARRSRSPWLLVIALGLGVFVGGFDQTFVVPVLSTILSDLNITVDQFGKASWIINGYLLGYTVAMPLMGRVADVYGHLRVFVISLLIFMGGSVLVALSPNLTMLTLARAVTALGGGALVPVALAIAADRLPPHARPLGLSAISVLDDASSLLGPLWGTLVGVTIGWRGLFWMNIVLSLPVLFLVVLLARGHRVRRPVPVDWTGGGLLALALLFITFALADTGVTPRPLWQSALLYGLGAALMAAFVWWELHTPHPMIDLRMFRIARLSAANVMFFLEGGALITALVNIPLMDEVLWGGNGAEPGLMLMRMVLFMIVGGVLGGVLAPRLGFRWTALIGFVLATVGLGWMRAWPQEPNEAQRWAALAVAGLGFTLPDAPLYATIVNAVEAGRRAAATAVLQVCQTTGMIVGMALLASRGLGRFNQRAAAIFGQEGVALDEAKLKVVQHQTFDETFLVAALATAVAAVLALTLESTRLRTKGWRDVFGFRAAAEDQP